MGWWLEAGFSTTAIGAKRMRNALFVILWFPVASLPDPAKRHRRRQMVLNPKGDRCAL